MTRYYISDDISRAKPYVSGDQIRSLFQLFFSPQTSRTIEIISTQIPIKLFAKCCMHTVINRRSCYHECKIFNIELLYC